MIDPAQTDPGSFWDRMYDVEGFRYGTAPNAFMAKSLPSHLKKGQSVLCVGDGEGRNGVWCAEQGYAVTSIEPSGVGAKKIAKLAEARGVRLEIVRDHMPSPGVDDASFDAVVLSYVHTSPSMRSAVHDACIRALRPGAVIVLEAFSKAQLDNERKSGGPRNPDMLFTTKRLSEDFAALDILLLEEEIIELDEGPGHTGEADVVRMIAILR